MKRGFALLVPVLLAIMVLSGGVAQAGTDTPIGFPMTDAPGWWRYQQNGGWALVKDVPGVPDKFGTQALLMRAGTFGVPGTGGQVVVSTDIPAIPGITGLGDLTKLNFWTYTFPESPSSTATFQIAVDIDGGVPTWDTNLVFVPSSNGTVSPGEWQFWNAVGGKWYSTRDIGVAGQGSPATLAEILAAHPSASVALLPGDPGGSIKLQFGSSGGDEAGHRTMVDHVVIQRTILPQITTDFEAILPSL